ncbi:MAG: transposase, partial [Capsulimonadales bacterium]|nr:transposase [Capsulimonadales bacterium]
GLRLLFLPPYRPELNRIEVLWRQVKYRWLGLDAYRSFPFLCQSVRSVLDNVGGRYRISFG